MNEKIENIGTQACWFVGSTYDRTKDQLPRFLAESIWELRNPTNKESSLVKSMKAGDRIAIKAAYTRKRNLPFDNHGQTVSVMSIKAIGIITENLQNGEHIRVDWTHLDPAREWYFYTYRATIWRVLPGEWETDGLIAFAFSNTPQDINRFCNAPYWRERFGSVTPDKLRFKWTRFYEAIADKLLDYRNNRTALVNGIRDISQRIDGGLGHLNNDNYTDGGTGFVRDICPFTAMGMFNRGITESNRKIIAGELATFLGVEEAVPDTFEGIPVLNNMKSWFFPYEIERSADHIDALWDVFAAAINFADSDEDDTHTTFADAFDNVNGRPVVAWNLTMGLYWTRPWTFPSLDNNSQTYIKTKLGVPIGLHGPKSRCNSADYLSVMDAIEPRFKEPSYPIHSYPELSLEAWQYKAPSSDTSPTGIKDDEQIQENKDEIQESVWAYVPSIVPYTVEDILKDGCFLEREEISLLLDRLNDKKNLILQGPPGTGKTWLAKRLAFALIGQKDESKIRAVQFHPNLSYEDFVRGWRPTGEGKLSLADGVFIEAIKAAVKNPSSKFVVVIEEINRGNPAQIFGELLTLLESGKRNPNEALELCYPDANGDRYVYVPENLYVIGTMNIADRSLALVDLALRRRFAFVGLEPKLGKTWQDWVVNKCNIDSTLVAEIERRINALNKQIVEDPRLGKQFQIGHSYVTPSDEKLERDTKKWFKQVVDTEIGPLLDEYWFDAPNDAKKACELLLENW